MERTRINLVKTGPNVFQALLKLDSEASELANAAGFSEGLSHLMRLRASQINQCAYCVRRHSRDALAANESSDRIAMLSAWRESQYFTEKERAAIALIEAVTLVSEGQVPDDVYSEAASVLSDQEISAVEWLGIVINVWNRFATASRYPVEPRG